MRVLLKFQFGQTSFKVKEMNSKKTVNSKITLKEAMAIGIGGMVGGGIFAVLGLAVSIAKGGTPVSFLLAGILALITSYSYVKLSKKYPDRGGTVKFINKGFGKSVFSGSINNLLWISYIIMLSLYASAFGSYAPNLLQITHSRLIDSHIYANAIIILATAINYYSIKVVGKIESYAVVIKLIILIGFITIGAYGLKDTNNLVQLTISNAAPDIDNPERNLPKAYYYSVIFVIVLYIIITIVTIGLLPFKTITIAQDYVLAEAAKPTLGNTGFTIITIAALISTFSAINASLYGGSRVNFEIAEDDELPHHFLAQFWNQPIGLLITAISTLILVNTLKLESISTAGSIGFLIIFGIVNYVGYKLSNKIDANKLIPLIGIVLSTIALLILVNQQYKSNFLGVLISISIILACFLIEWIYKKSKH